MRSAFRSSAGVLGSVPRRSVAAAPSTMKFAFVRSISLVAFAME